MFIELKHLRTLQRLNESGSLVAAAERLHLTQSALSHQLKAVEDYFGTALFLRKSRPLRLTPAGQRLLELADTILPQVEASERDLHRLASGQSGRLHIAIECHTCFQWLMPTMDAYREHWPEIEMDLSLGFSFEPLPALARGDIDLVVTSDPQPIPGLCYQPLFRYPVLLAMAKTHDLAEKAWIAPEDLREQTLITYPVERARLDVFTGFLNPAGVEPAAVRTSELTAMIMQLVASQRGISALPSWALAEYLERDYLAARPLTERGLWCTLYCAVREEERALPYLDEFLTVAGDTCFRTLDGISPAA